MKGTEPGPAARLLIGNLDFEVALARDAAAGRREHRPLARPLGETEGGRHRAGGGRHRGEEAPPAGDGGFDLPVPVQSAISALATLLRAFARDGDRLWTPREVAAERMAPVSGLPLPLLETGPLERLSPAEMLAWGETAGIGRARSLRPGTGSRSPGERCLPPPAGPGRGIAGALWTTPAPSAAASARVNHRSFCLEAAESLGLALPGARMLRSLEEIDAHLRSGEGLSAAGGGWVLKAPFSAAGRSRLRGRGPLTGGPSRRRAARLLALHAGLLFEPWMERLADFGLSALLLEGECRILGVHRLLLDGGGNFRGIDLLPPAGEPLEPGGDHLSPEEEALFTATAKKIGERLRGAGYRGPFGLDGWRYRAADGEARFHPLGEINARMTFGLVARALAERTAGEIRGQSRGASLNVGGREEMDAAFASGRESVALLFPGREDRTAAWLELADR